MDQEFNHAANDSPRSGSSKQVTPVVWCAVVVAIVALGTWLAIGLRRLARPIEAAFAIDRAASGAEAVSVILCIPYRRLGASLHVRTTTGLPVE